MITKVIKRDGTEQNFSLKKLKKAIRSSFTDLNPSFTKEDQVSVTNIAKSVTESFHGKVDVETIQDAVEKRLMQEGYLDQAKQYILYRDARARARINTIDKTLQELVSGDSDYWNNENSNKNAKIVTTQRDYIAGITSTDAARRFILPKEVVEAHDAGIIHQHDMDYMLQSALHNCDLISLKDMLLNGTVINGVAITAQHRLRTAATVATQIITAVSSSQYGGCTISLSHLAPFVKMSYDFHLNKYLFRGFEDDLAEKYAKEDLKNEITASVQTFNYQINSMSTTNGQAPFLSVAMYLTEEPEYESETAMLIEEFLKQRIKGLPNELGVPVTQAFPKLLYFLDDNNVTPDSKYWYLTQLAAECTAKRMVPDYISVKVMKNLKGDAYPCMGCRSYLTPDRCTENWAKDKTYVAGKGKYYGRFNMGVTTLNLFDAALSSHKDQDEFWKILNERCELCHVGLKVRIDRLLSVTSDCAPILWQHGALARLDKGEKLTNLVHHGYATASLGYAGLYECVKYLTGESHTSEKGREFGLKVMQFLNDKCAEWKAAEDIDYSVYGTPIESTTYKFAKCLKKRFGDDVFEKLDGTDRNYITNSYHVPVFEEIDAFTKLKKESEFQKLSPGGAISYVECADLTHNLDAVIQVMQYIYDNIMYAELNTKSDYCHVCGCTQPMQIIDENNRLQYKCPNCGNEDPSLMNVARRVCGYISTTPPNQGRLDEFRNRYVHLDNRDDEE